MRLFYGLIIGFCISFGIYYLFFAEDPVPVYAVHYFILGLYFYITFYELMGKPFSTWLYYLVMVLLIIDGLFNLIIMPSSLLSGLISLFFAFSTWQSLKRLKSR
jgi:hypothetical protein